MTEPFPSREKRSLIAPESLTASSKTSPYEVFTILYPRVSSQTVFSLSLNIIGNIASNEPSDSRSALSFDPT